MESGKFNIFWIPGEQVIVTKKIIPAKTRGDFFKPTVCFKTKTKILIEL